MQDISFKANSGQFNIDEAQGIVECFVAGIGNKDSVGDICVTGAFAKSLQRRKPRVVWGHNWNDPIGKVLEIYEVPPNDPRLPTKMKIAGIGGLYAKVQFNLNSEKGREAFTNVAFFGEEQEWSIGYKTLDAVFDNAKQANLLREVELYELSPVLHGANQLTGTISVKSDEKNHGMMPMATLVLEDKPEEPRDPFAQGLAQPLGGDKLIALTNELSERTGGPIKVMKANESSVVFLKPGKGLFRLGYYFDGEQYMFGKPEKLSSPMVLQPMQGMPNAGRMTPGMHRMPDGTMMPNSGPRAQRVPNFPTVQRKPASTEGPIIPVKYGESNVQSGLFDSLKSLDEIFEEKMLAGDGLTDKLQSIVSSLQDIIGQETEEKTAWMIPCDVKDLFNTKQAIDPVLNYHRIESFVTEEGIVLTSPMDYEAFEAVDTATKNLLGRIGRGLAPGGGGKARRARGALSRIEGVQDPQKRRDIDGDGMIFDGTWREMPDPSRSPNRADGLRSSTDNPDAPVIPPQTDAQRRARERNKKRKPGDLLWYQQAARDGRPPAPIFISRELKPKLDRMFDDVVGQFPDDHIVRRIQKAIKEAVRYQEKPMGVGRPQQTSLYLPDIDDGMLKELQAVWPQAKDVFREFGGHRQTPNGKMEKGVTPYEIMQQIVETGGFERKNKLRPKARGGVDDDVVRERDYVGPGQRGGTGPKVEPRVVGGVDLRAGKESAAAGTKRTTKYPKDRDGNQLESMPFVIRRDFSNRLVIQDSLKDVRGKDTLQQYIDAGHFPKDWREMDGEKKFEWIVANKEKLDKLTSSPQWRVWVKNLYETLQEMILDLDEKREAEAIRAAKPNSPSVIPKPDAPKIPKPDTPKEPKGVDVPKAPKATNPVGNKKADQLSKQIVAWQETVSLATDRDGVESDFVDAANDAAERIMTAVFPDEGEPPTDESISNALEEVDSSIRELAQIGEERRLSKTERGILNFFPRVREFLEEYQGERGSDREVDLGAEQAREGLARRGEAVERFGLDDDDEDVLGGADIDEVYGSERTGGEEGFFEEDLGRGDGLSSRTNSNISRAVARASNYQKAHRRRKQARGGGLSSSTDNKVPRTQVTTESTWWKKIDESIPAEIKKADSDVIRKGLTLLQQKIAKYEAGAFRPNSKRTNVGFIKISADEADQILDAVMAVIDRQRTAGKGGTVGSRGEIFAELLEKVSSAAMSTFVDKTSKPVDA